jgi:3-oxoacyl-[acyl-carrier protein] reductase
VLTGQVVLVTGASRGIGKAIALDLGRQNATVIGTATTENGAQQIEAYLHQAHISGAGVLLNVLDHPQAENVIRQIESRFGSVTVLVNNAGITRDNLLVRMKDEEWDEIINVNLRSVYWLSKLVLRSMMKARFGRIINITSVAAAMGNPGQTNYAAAKAGVVGFSKSLAREVASRNITVNCIAPGFIETDMTHALTEQQRATMLQHIPLGRFGEVSEIATAVAFLASPKAGYITGATLHINGGMYMD